MDFGHLKRVGRGDDGNAPGHLQNLLQISRYWQKLDRDVQRILPANLRAHIQTACIENNELVLLAANNMAASRLKMLLPSLQPQLLGVHEGLEAVRVRLIPKAPPPPKANHLALGDAAVGAFEQAAERVAARHPDLAAALARLAEKHKKR
ncbi:DciA family protein [Bergeriella denitrificans]|uniref:Protein of uncharacterized function (DUF721) n=1 Tax=Bergeriella denitrificans TaxID=494 RepID=A0A378UDJ8_BERDE|nr:DciA family protein [Bergeriella denitrificans]STZ75478.1 Protein of uncharacterised function (DUF721) [Bergeriella denitrificans]